MIIASYKYNPIDFSHILGLLDDLTTFYNLHNEYINDKTQSKRFALEKHGEDLFFTIKHRALEGAITGTTAHELREHMEELLYID
ncbi:MAG: hypothetical protein FWE90_01265 [Defluviitaleaceae bacterium]|nr:hypothetical protein [Defluviitaleaceae bacterium]